MPTETIAADNVTAQKDTQERAALVTTAHQGVFFGYTADTPGDTISIRRGRNIPRWRNTRGFLGLASSGPNAECRVGPAADIERLTDITCVALCTPEAVLAWEAAPWAK